MPTCPQPSRRKAKPIVWDDRSHQPHRIHKRHRRLELLKHLPIHARMSGIWLRSLPGVLIAYRRRMKELFHAPADLPRGFCVGTDGAESEMDAVLGEVSALGAQGVMVRAPVWELEQLDRRRAFLEALRERGIATSVAILQDRRAVTDPPFWRDALERIIGTLGPAADVFGIGHAWNRLKWGVRNYEEYRRLYRAAVEVRGRHPGVRLLGPSVIDFEFHYAAGPLLDRREQTTFDVIGSLLYVDRRGTPENRQYGHFDLARKIAFLAAFVDRSPSRGAPIWITETNWPLRVAGGYAPTSMKEAVGEEHQADCLVRYYLIALATGMAERVFWWQVAARGYGLIDNLGGEWRRRPAWHAFRTMTGLLAGARLAAAHTDREKFAFTFLGDGRTVTAAWATGRSAELTLPHPVAEVVSRDGHPLPKPAGERIALSPSPVYLLGFATAGEP